MQLLSLYIEEHKNLKNFNWEITEEFATPALLVMGKNASGKTNLLEAIVKIFDFLYHKEQKAPFTFKIEYKIQVVTIRFEVEKNVKLNGVYIDDKFVPIEEVIRVNNTFLPRRNIDYELTSLLPKNVVLYYSGFSRRFHHLAYNLKRRYGKQYRGKKAENAKMAAINLPSVFVIEPIHFKMILLSLFAFERPEDDLESPIYKFLKEYFDIERLDSFEIQLRKHTNWVVDKGYENFFDTVGVVRNFIESIHLSQLDNINDETTNLPELLRSNQNRDIVNRVTYRFNNENFVRDIIKPLGVEKDLFSLLNILLISGNLIDIHLTVKKAGVEKPLHFDSLSEGEQQFLAIRGMEFLLQGYETLFLWDEPDTFLNPTWQWNLIPNIENAINPNSFQRDQFIITTHSPVLLSTVSKRAYYMDKGELSSVNNTYGLTVDQALLKQDIAIRKPEFQDKLNSYLLLIEEGKHNEEQALALRSELEEALGENHDELQRADVLISFYED